MSVKRFKIELTRTVKLRQVVIIDAETESEAAWTALGSCDFANFKEVDQRTDARVVNRSNVEVA